jgi:transcriptional regulator with XRE-family HTH domain
MKLFGTKVSRRLDELDLKQAQAARAIGVDASQFSRWLKPNHQDPRLTPGQLLRLARYLKLPIEFLVDDRVAELPGVDVSVEEEKILDMVRTLGYGEAKRRLMMAVPLGEAASATASPSVTGPGSMPAGTWSTVAVTRKRSDSAPVPVKRSRGSRRDRLKSRKGRPAAGGGSRVQSRGHDESPKGNDGPA